MLCGTIWFLAKDKVSAQPSPSRHLLFLTLIISISVGVYSRIFHLSSTTFGHFIFEEISASVIYVADMWTGEKTYSGSTQIVYAVLMDAWRKIGGTMSVAWARGISGLMGALALPLLFLSLKRVINSRVAALATGLLAMSLYGSFFSRMAFETGWSIFFYCLSLYLLTVVLLSKERLWPWTVVGLSLGLGVFTYPGFTVMLAASLCAFLTVFLIRRSEFLNRTQLVLIAKRGALVAFGLLTVAIPSLIFHFRTQAHAHLFKGGGVFWDSLDKYITALSTVLRDIFIAGDSYYLPYQSVTVVESSYWGFFIIGAYVSLKDRKLWAQVLTFSIFFLIFIVSLATNYPGMRRGILILVPFYIFTAIGLESFLNLVASLPQKSLKVVASILIFTALLVPSAYHIEALDKASRVAPYSEHSEFLENPALLRLLDAFEVYYIRDEIPESDVKYIIRYFTLLNRYLEKPYKITFLNSRQDIPISSIKPNLYLAKNTAYFEPILQSPELCKSKIQDLGLRFQRFYFIQAERADSPICREITD